MPFKNALFALLLLPKIAAAQNFTSYFTGDTTDVTTPTYGGAVLMGGASENDNAMRWFLDRSGGGDILVLRASGSDGYNSYLFSGLGKTVNSVETILFKNATASSDPYVLKQIKNAEAIWLAGGDQSKYIDYWKNNAVEAALQDFIDKKKGVIGGTSAGMAVLGEGYFYAKNGTILSADALANPFNPKVSLGTGDFLKTPFLEKVITDTHYDSPDRRGRHLTFIARLATLENARWRGIACEEYTAVCVDTLGIARVFGTTGDPDHAWFLQTNCAEPFLPENCATGSPLTWERGSSAVKGYQIKGNDDGTNFFDLNEWKTGSGGSWFNWWAIDGLLSVAPVAVPPDCSTGTGEGLGQDFVKIYPNPNADRRFWLEFDSDFERFGLKMFDSLGRQVLEKQSSGSGKYEIVCPENLPGGLYWLRLEVAGKVLFRNILMEN